MQAVFSDGYVTFHRDASDPRIYGTRFAKGEHGLMHRIARWLNDRGFDVIKKRAQGDGHMIGDNFSQYRPVPQAPDRRATYLYLVPVLRPAWSE